MFKYKTKSDESTSPEDAVAGNSPRINRFLARAPPDGCEKVTYYLIICNLKNKFYNKF